MTDHHFNRLTDAIDRLTNILTFNADYSRILLCVDKELESINHKLKLIMSAISDYTTAVNSKFDKIESQIGTLSGEVQAIEDLLTKINNNPGPISAEDQKLLDDSLTRVGGLSDKLEAVITIAANPPATPSTT